MSTRASPRENVDVVDRIETVYCETHDIGSLANWLRLSPCDSFLVNPQSVDGMRRALIFPWILRHKGRVVLVLRAKRVGNATGISSQFVARPPTVSLYILCISGEQYLVFEFGFVDSPLYILPHI